MSVARLKGLGGRLVLLVGTTALMVGFGASAASAEVILSPAPPYEGTEELVTVSGTPTAKAEEEGANEMAAAVCNTEFPPGKRCDVVSATPGFKTIEEFENEEVVIKVRKGPWANFDFTMGFPQPAGGTTTCNPGVCAIEVSYYRVEEESITQVDAESVPISF